MNFIIIAILVFLGIMLALKMNNIRTKIAYFLITIGIGFLLLTGFIVVSGKNLDTSTIDGISSAAKTYVVWFGHAGSNVMKVSSYVVNQEWRGDSETNSTG